MKKLFGVMILAGFPVACGSTLPSAPDMAEAPATAQDAGAASLAKGRGPAPVPPATCDSTDSRIDGIRVSITSETRRSVTLRADAVVLDSDRLTPCFTPRWTFSPLRRGATLSVGWDAQTATLTGPAGRYEVQATAYTSGGRAIVGSALVTIG
jgi:hypothetical protein